MLISDISEDALIAEVTAILPRRADAIVPTGDDCAVLAFTGNTAVSTDLLVEGTHFRCDWGEGKDIGFRAAMQNLADAVAIGAQPISLVIGLGLPRDTKKDWVLDFAQGVKEACVPLGVGVDGGDFVAADKIIVSVTVLGDVHQPILRAGARPGDLVIHSGKLGCARAGYELLQAGYRRNTAEKEFSALITDFLRPTPPLQTALAAVKEGNLHALMDVSDGLIMDGRRLARASRMSINLHNDAFGAAFRRIAKAAGRLGARRAEWIFTGGEDHGFLATISPKAPLPAGFIPIGEVGSADPHGRVYLDGKEFITAGGWDHFHQ